MANNLYPVTSVIPGATTPASSSSASADPASTLATEQTFLQLLVAQMKNQDPLNPTDSLQFVSQLAQFSQLEQMLAVRQDTDGILKQLTPAAQTQS